MEGQKFRVTFELTIEDCGEDFTVNEIREAVSLQLDDCDTIFDGIDYESHVAGVTEVFGKE